MNETGEEKAKKEQGMAKVILSKSRFGYCNLLLGQPLSSFQVEM